jgi:putative nucleotidyltransferase with HDIG domain
MKPHLPLSGRGRKKDSDRKNGRRRRIDLQRTGLAVVTVMALSVLLCVHVLPDKVSLAVADKAPEDIRAQRSVSYADTYEFQKRQDEAKDAIGKIYDRVPYALDESLRELNVIFSVIDSTQNDRDTRTAEEKAASARTQIKAKLDIDASPRAILSLVQAPKAELNRVHDVTTKLVHDVMSVDVRDDIADISKAHVKASIVAEEALVNSSYANAAAEIAKAVIKPNMRFNLKETASARDKASAAIKPVYRYIRTGDLIISKGETVTQEHVDKFTALGLRQKQIDYRTVLLLSALVAFLVGLVIIYLARYQKQIYKSTRLLLMLSLVVTMSTLGLKLSEGLLGVQLPGLHSAHLGILLTTTAGMVLAILLNPQVSVLIVAMLSIASGLVMNNELRYATSTLISGLVSIYAVANIRGRTDQMRTIGVIAITNIAIVWIMGGLFRDSVTDMAFGSIWAVLIAILASWIFWHVSWLLERPFRVTTHISLLELADTNRPMLRRLVVEAPGTYTHSMAVGHLAEAAAEAIGADSLFARVASYYHDIGKIRRPHFFVENQGVENAHDRLNPTLSALVITSHIKDGLEVAREFKLPPSIQEVILQHHGTSLVQYFYNQVSEQVEPTPLLEQQFRYDGPKPQSKESAIVMLADSVEAASRSLAKPTPVTLETLVRKVVMEKLQDGQLDDSELTFHDVGIIKETFARTLSGTLHARIEYQDVVAAENGKILNNGDSNQEPAAVACESDEAEDNG